MSLTLSKDRIIRPGCFESEIKNPPLHEKCTAAGRCNLADACMWTKDEIDLREDPNRGADTANMNNVLGSR